MPSVGVGAVISIKTRAADRFKDFWMAVRMVTGPLTLPWVGYDFSLLLAAHPFTAPLRFWMMVPAPMPASSAGPYTVMGLMEEPTGNLEVARFSIFNPAGGLRPPTMAFTSPV